MSLFSKYRPVDFNTLVNQEHIVSVLQNQIIENNISSSYLFFGTRGTGKTTVARIIAKAVNCENTNNGNPCNNCDKCNIIGDNKTLDFVEIDAASHTQVDNIREEILDKVYYRPNNLNKKVYIIDEVHMLSKAAFNALLKIIEEPPEYIVFILATTEINKVPDTILSRCQVFNFRRLKEDDISEKLKNICDKEDLGYDDKGISLISRFSDGSLRDSIKYIDQTSILGDINENNVVSFLGIVSDATIENFINMLKKGDEKGNFELIDQLQDSGIDMFNFAKQILFYINEHFEEDIDFYSKLIDLFKDIIYNIKTFGFGIIVYKKTIHKFIIDEFGNKNNFDNIYSTSESDEVESYKEDKSSYKYNGDYENNKNISSEDSNEYSDHFDNRQNEDKIDVENNKGLKITDKEVFFNNLLENIEKVSLKTSIKKYCSIAELSAEHITIYVISETQYNIIIKQENFDYIKQIIESIQGQKIDLFIKYISKEEYLKNQLS